MPYRAIKARQRAYHSGIYAEYIAALFLILKGYKILGLRFNIRGGEIDIVAQKGRCVAFIEVKLRRSLDDAYLAIDATKRRHISHAVKVWLCRHPWAMALNLRGDALYLAPWSLPRHRLGAIELNID